MRAFLFIFIFFYSSISFSQNIFIAPSMSFVYGSGEDDATSSLLGPGFAIAGGMNIGVSVFEIEFKRLKLSSSQIGNKDYETEIYDSVFSGGFRLLLNNIFSIKTGIATHFIEMDIFKDGVKQRNTENDGDYTGLYGGMGIMTKFSNSSQLFLESTLYPIPDVDMYVVDMQAGLRIYL